MSPNFGIDSLLDELGNDTVFEEKPVSVEVFVTDDKYLGLPPLSPYQIRMIKAGSQIYRRDTLDEYLSPEDAEKRANETYSEIIMKLGKGSGKDYCSSIICAYIVYLILCLKDPQDYYGKPAGDSIDIMNIAINSDQARRVFFKNIKDRLKTPWFQGKYNERGNEIEFYEKNVRLVSGHSKAESLEGYNVMVVILDEISGFDDEAGNGEKQITAESTYEMHSNSVLSRFGEDGKLLLLSFPRHRECFISKRYREVIGEKETIIRTHTFKLDETAPDGIDGNYLTIEWEEDHITKYTLPGVYALQRPSWEVNPTKKIEDYKLGFMRNPVTALSKFACMPPEAVDAFFRDKAKLEKAFIGLNGIDENGVFYEDFLPEENKKYYIHVDLAQKHDRCVVAMAHVDHWTTQQYNFSALNTKAQAFVKVDLIKYWEPTPTSPVDFAAVRDFIVSVRDRGFNIELVTFDQYRSEDFIKYLRSINMRVDILHAGNPQYFDMANLFSEERIIIPKNEIALTEYLQLRSGKNNKIDHPRNGHDDLAIAIAGAASNAVKKTRREDGEEIELVTYKKAHTPVVNNEANVIQAPKSTKHMQPELREFMERSGLRML